MRVEGKQRSTKLNKHAHLPELVRLGEVHTLGTVLSNAMRRCLLGVLLAAAVAVVAAAVMVVVGPHRVSAPRPTSGAAST